MFVLGGVHIVLWIEGFFMDFMRRLACNLVYGLEDGSYGQPGDPLMPPREDTK